MAGKKKGGISRFWTMDTRTEKTLGWEIVHHRTTILMILSIPFAFYIARWLNQYLGILGSYGYAGGFLAGTLYTYSLTSMAAAAVIYVLGQAYNPFLLALLGATGAVVSDYIIFRIIRDNITGELQLLAKELHFHISKKMIKSKWITWGVGIIAAMIIASPLPDAIGIALLAVANYKVRNLVLIAYPMNFFGLLTMATLGSL